MNLDKMIDEIFKDILNPIYKRLIDSELAQMPDLPSDKIARIEKVKNEFTKGFTNRYRSKFKEYIQDSDSIISIYNTIISKEYKQYYSFIDTVLAYKLQEECVILVNLLINEFPK